MILGEFWTENSLQWTLSCTVSTFILLGKFEFPAAIFVLVLSAQGQILKSLLSPGRFAWVRASRYGPSCLEELHSMVYMCSACRVANRYSTDCKGFAQVSSVLLSSTYNAHYSTPPYLHIHDSHHDGFMPDWRTKVCFPRPSIKMLTGSQQVSVLNSKMSTLLNPPNFQELITYRMNGRSWYWHSPKGIKCFSSFWLISTEKDKQIFTIGWESSGKMTFPPSTTCCATSAIVCEVI